MLTINYFFFYLPLTGMELSDGFPLLIIGTILDLLMILVLYVSIRQDLLTIKSPPFLPNNLLKKDEKILFQLQDVKIRGSFFMGRGYIEATPGSPSYTTHLLITDMRIIEANRGGLIHFYSFRNNMYNFWYNAFQARNNPFGHLSSLEIEEHADGTALVVSGSKKEWNFKSYIYTDRAQEIKAALGR